MKIVVGGQIDKQDIANIIKAELGEEAEVTVKGDLDATMGMKAGTYDYYVGACNTGGGGALAMALAIFVKETVQKGTILLSKEGPVDLYGFGDSIFGHFSDRTWAIQKKSGKGLMRVANMCGVSALAIPEEDLGCCTLLLCDSNPQDIINMLKIAENYVKPQSALIERYFGNFQMYFEG